MQNISCCQSGAEPKWGGTRFPLRPVKILGWNHTHRCCVVGGQMGVSYPREGGMTVLQQGRGSHSSPNSSRSKQTDQRLSSHRIYTEEMGSQTADNGFFFACAICDHLHILYERGVLGQKMNVTSFCLTGEDYVWGADTGGTFCEKCGQCFHLVCRDYLSPNEQLCRGDAHAHSVDFLVGIQLSFLFRTSRVANGVMHVSLLLLSWKTAPSKTQHPSKSYSTGIVA